MKILLGALLGFWGIFALIWFWIGPITTLALFHDPRLVLIVAKETTDYPAFFFGEFLFTLLGLAFGIRLQDQFQGW